MYDGEGRNIYRKTDGKSRLFVYDGNTVIYETGMGGAAARNVYGVNLISRTVSGVTALYGYNGHGDVINLTSDGTAVAAYYYDEFGNNADIENYAGVFAELFTDEESAGFDNPYRYAGYEYIEEVGLYDLSARYYDAKIARFLSPDPYYDLGNRVIGLYEINVPTAASIMQANNLFAYCMNDSVGNVDPDGEIAITTIILIGSIVVGAVAAGYTAYKSYQYSGKIDWKATIINGVSWGMMAYTLGMSAYAVYVDYCSCYGYTPVTEIEFSDNQSFLQKAANTVKSSAKGHVSGTKQHSEFKKILMTQETKCLEPRFRSRTVLRFNTAKKVA